MHFIEYILFVAVLGAEYSYGAQQLPEWAVPSAQSRTINKDTRYVAWTNRRVPYCIDPIMTSEEVGAIAGAIQSMTASMRYCSINFFQVPCSSTEYHIRFTTTTSSQPYSSSYPGRVANVASNVYEQVITLSRTDSQRCSTTKRCVLKFIAIALGKRNEHQRADRGSYITVASDNALTAPAAYRLYSGVTEADWTSFPYDYCSITHNQPNEFAASTAQPAFTVRAGGSMTCIPKLETISETDCRLISKNYGCLPAICDPVPCTSAQCSGSTTGTGFQQSSYSFTTATCTAGSFVGTVQSNGAAGYYIVNGNNQFTVSQAGVVTLLAAVPAGTYTIILGTTGIVPNNVPATITVSCSGTAPTTPRFSQTSYTLSTTGCTAGSSVGSVTATGATGYLISNFQFTISTTGQITMPGGVAAGTYTAMVTAFNQQGASSVPVTITVSCSGSGTGATTFPQTSYTFATSACTPGTSVGSAAATGASGYSISNFQFAVSTTGQITMPGGVAAGTYTAMVTAFGQQGSSSVPVTITVRCSGTSTGAASFAQTSYTFTTSACATGTPVGSVTGNNINQYAISNSQFTISGNGQISLSSPMLAGTYFAVVSGFGAQTSSSVGVTITVTCSGTSTGAVVFPQASYTFSTSTCTAGTTAGTVSASNANRYTISNAQFIISATGQITLANAMAAGTYSATLTGSGNAGSASVPVTITVSCGGNPSTGNCAANVSPTYSGSTTCSASSSDLGYPITPSQVSAADITTILDTHNTYRRGVDSTNMRKLRWDPCLASSAQAWANKCDATNPHDSYAARKAPGFPQGCGQNKASGTSGFMTWKSAIDLWFNEVKDFSYCASTNVFEKVGHYTQVMWADTSLIGCGFARCNGMDAYFCNYCTPGNFGSQPAIFCPWKQGTKCSACSTGSGCTAGDCLCA